VSAASEIQRQWGDDMTMTDVGLWIIFAALIALVPAGCILTRPTKK
jgi:hypothetical protein